MSKNGIERFDMHTSGHADEDTIFRLIDTVKPKKVKFVHTELESNMIETMLIDKINK